MVAGWTAAFVAFPKVPILMVFMAIAAFLFVTQQDLFSSSLALVIGVTTIITALFKVESK